VLGLGTAIPGHQYFKSILHKSCCTRTTAV